MSWIDKGDGCGRMYVDSMLSISRIWLLSWSSFSVSSIGSLTSGMEVEEGGGGGGGVLLIKSA